MENGTRGSKYQKAMKRCIYRNHISKYFVIKSEKRQRHSGSPTSSTHELLSENTTSAAKKRLRSIPHSKISKEEKNDPNNIV